MTNLKIVLPPDNNVVSKHESGLPVNNVTPSASSRPVVKSAGRALAVLEVFQAVRRPASAREVARLLDMPRSSTNALLSSLVTLGYLLFDRETNAYFPSLKVGLLGDWLIGSVRGDPALSRILTELSAGTGETVTLAVRAGFQIQFVTIIPSTFPVALNIAEGALADLFESAVGIAWLAAHDRAEIEQLVQSQNQRAQDAPVDLSRVLARVEEARERGASVAYEKVLPDTGAIALAYGQPIQGQTVVIGIGGPQDRFRRSEVRYVDLVRKLVRTPVHRVHG